MNRRAHMSPPVFCMFFSVIGGGKGRTIQANEGSLSTFSRSNAYRFLNVLLRDFSPDAEEMKTPSLRKRRPQTVNREPAYRLFKRVWPHV